MTQSTADKFVARFPDGLRERLKDASKVSKRSMNSELVHRLILSLDQDLAPTLVGDQLAPSTEAGGVRWQPYLGQLVVYQEVVGEITGFMVGKGVVSCNVQPMGKARAKPVTVELWPVNQGVSPFTIKA